MEMFKDYLDEMEPKVNLKASKCYYISIFIYVFLEMVFSKINPNFKDRILKILDDSEDLQPVGDLHMFPVCSKKIS